MGVVVENRILQAALLRAATAKEAPGHPVSDLPSGCELRFGFDFTDSRLDLGPGSLIQAGDGEWMCVLSLSPILPS